MSRAKIRRIRKAWARLARAYLRDADPTDLALGIDLLSWFLNRFDRTGRP